MLNHVEWAIISISRKQTQAKSWSCRYDHPNWHNVLATDKQTSSTISVVSVENERNLLADRMNKHVKHDRSIVAFRGTYSTLKWPLFLIKQKNYMSRRSVCAIIVLQYGKVKWRSESHRNRDQKLNANPSPVELRKKNELWKTKYAD